MEQTFLNLPISTVIDKPLPKTQFFKHFGTDSKEQTKFNEDISRIYISNLISEKTIALPPGNKIKQFYVLKIITKDVYYTDKSILTIVKNIPQNMVLAICNEDRVQISVYYDNKLYKQKWVNLSSISLSLEGLDIEAVWNNLVSSIANLDSKKANTSELKLSLEQQAKIEKLEKKLEVLDKKAKKEVQPRQRLELFHEVRELKKEIEKLRSNSI